MKRKIGPLAAIKTMVGAVIRGRRQRKPEPRPLKQRTHRDP